MDFFHELDFYFFEQSSDSQHKWLDNWLDQFGILLFDTEYVNVDIALMKSILNCPEYTTKMNHGLLRTV